MFSMFFFWSFPAFGPGKRRCAEKAVRRRIRIPQRGQTTPGVPHRRRYRIPGRIPQTSRIRRRHPELPPSLFPGPRYPQFGFGQMISSSFPPPVSPEISSAISRIMTAAVSRCPMNSSAFVVENISAEMDFSSVSVSPAYSSDSFPLPGRCRRNSALSPRFIFRRRTFPHGQRSFVIAFSNSNSSGKRNSHSPLLLL